MLATGRFLCRGLEFLHLYFQSRRAGVREPSTSTPLHGLTSPLTGLGFFPAHIPHGFAMGYMTSPASRAKSGGFAGTPERLLPHGFAMGYTTSPASRAKSGGFAGTPERLLPHGFAMGYTTSPASRAKSGGFALSSRTPS
jgi:hypothetical protein